MIIIDILGDEEDIVKANDTKESRNQRRPDFVAFPQLQLVTLDQVEDITNHSLFQHNILDP